MKKNILIGILILFSLSKAFTVNMIDRNVFINPFDTVKDTDTGWLYQTTGWGEFAHYIYTTDEEHFWDARFGAGGEIYRYKNRFSVTFESALELVSSSNSIIHFQPRAIFWHEALLGFYQYEDHLFSLGYYHRCKHDVDNLNYYITDELYFARVNIWDSVVFRWTTEPLVWNYSDHLSGSFQPHFENHFYLEFMSLDSVTIDYGGTNGWGERTFLHTDLKNTVGLSAEIDLLKNDKFRIYTYPVFYFDYYRKDGHDILPVDINWELGFAFVGVSFDFSIYCRYESKWDPGIQPYHDPGDYIQFGVRIL